MKRALIILAVFCVWTQPAWAALGGSVDSIQSDQIRLRGQLRTTLLQGYIVHQITARDGSIVKEFVSPAGKVFGVSWQGTAMPDLSQLLGTYYADFQNSPRPTLRRRGPVIVRTDKLVVESSGHMRAFHGRAYANDLLPANVAPEVVQ